MQIEVQAPVEPLRRYSNATEVRLLPPVSPAVADSVRGAGQRRAGVGERGGGRVVDAAVGHGRGGLGVAALVERDGAQVVEAVGQRGGVPVAGVGRDGVGAAVRPGARAGGRGLEAHATSARSELAVAASGTVPRSGVPGSVSDTATVLKSAAVVNEFAVLVEVATNTA